MKDKEVLYKTDWFDVIKATSESGGMMIGITQDEDNIVILPYTMENKVIKEIGVMHEHNPLREGDFWTTAVTGDIEDRETSLEAAKRELKEETGFDITDDSKWQYLGKLVMSKTVTMEHPCYAVDITGLELNDKKGDGTKNEKLSTFKIIPISDILTLKDGFILSIVMKYFFKNFKNIFNQ